MPGPVVNGVRQTGVVGQRMDDSSNHEGMLPLVAEGSIRLLLLSSGALLMARLRNTTDRDGDPAYQLIRPRLVERLSNPGAGNEGDWSLKPFLAGLTPQTNVVLFKAAVASVLDPDARMLQTYAELTSQECPLEETPVERLKRAFQEFTDSFDTELSEG